MAFRLPPSLRRRYIDVASDGRLRQTHDLRNYFIHGELAGAPPAQVQPHRPIDDQTYVSMAADECLEGNDMPTFITSGGGAVPLVFVGEGKSLASPPPLRTVIITIHTPMINRPIWPFVRLQSIQLREVAVPLAMNDGIHYDPARR